MAASTLDFLFTSLIFFLYLTHSLILSHSLSVLICLPQVLPQQVIHASTGCQQNHKSVEDRCSGCMAFSGRCSAADGLYSIWRSDCRSGMCNLPCCQQCCRRSGVLPVGVESSCLDHSHSCKCLMEVVPHVYAGLCRYLSPDSMIELNSALTVPSPWLGLLRYSHRLPFQGYSSSPYKWGLR